MQGYGQFCPIAKAAEIFCKKWTALIIRDLAFGATRFSELQKGVPLASPSLLSQRIKELIAEGVVERRRMDPGGGWSYHLSEAGQGFVPMIVALGQWGRTWSPKLLAEHEADLGLLLWTIESQADARAFGDATTIVELTFSDQPEAKRRWWFLNSHGECHMCHEKPSQTSDLYLCTTLENMIYIRRGDMPLDEAMEAGRLEADGPESLRRQLGKWLLTAPSVSKSTHAQTR